MANRLACTKHTRLCFWTTLILLGWILVPPWVFAIPPLPHTLSGTVLVSGENVQNGTVISAWVDGQQLSSTTTVIIPPVGGPARYSLDVPGDDLETPEDEGAADGELVSFFIGAPYSVWADQTATWHASASTNLPLTASSGVLATNTPTATPTPAGGVTPTNDWCDFYSSASIFNGASVQVGDVIDAYDPDGIHCGTFTVEMAGQWGLMHVYADDPITPEDEGAHTGDAISFRINGYTATVTSGNPTWNSKGLHSVDVSAWGDATPTGTPTQTETLTRTPTASATRTQTPTYTPTEAHTPSATPGQTFTPTPTPSATMIATPAQTATATATSTRTLTSTPSSTPSATMTPTPTQTARATQTRTPSKTATPTTTGCRLPTATPTRTFTSTPSRTPSHTVTPTSSDTPFQTATSTHTPNPTETPSPTPSITQTPTSLITPTPSLTPTATLSPTPSVGAITGIVWKDLDGDGLREGGEPRFKGVEVALSYLGIAFRRRTTGTDGWFQFPGLQPGQYGVSVESVSGYVASTDSSLTCMVHANMTIQLEFGLVPLPTIAPTVTTTATSVPTSTSTATHTVTATQTPAPTQALTPTPEAVSTTIPVGGGILVSRDGDVSLTIPPDCLPSDILLTITSQPSLPYTLPVGIAWAGEAFDITALGPGDHPVSQFACMLQLAVGYDDQAWGNAGVVNERRLRLYYWNNEHWVSEAGTSEIDPDANRLLIKVNRLALWALAGPTHSRVMLPLIERKAHRY